MEPSLPPTEFRSLLHYALQPTTRISAQHTAVHSGDEEGTAQGEGERLHKMIDAISFSRRFIQTYQLVLLGLLAIFTAKYWVGRLQARRKRRRHATAAITRREDLSTNGIKKGEPLAYGSGSSSSSSTLQDLVVRPKQASPIGTPNEQSSLLLKQSLPQRQSYGWSLACTFRSYLVYQPRPIPFINKTLPQNSTALAVIFLYALLAFYLFYNVQLSIPTFFVFADRASLVFVANLPLLYLFAAKNQPIKRLTGYSYESLNIFHRRLGEAMCFLAFLHSAGMVVVWYNVLRPTGLTLVQFLLLKIILLGIGAFVAYEALYFTSLGSFRQRWYELFLGLHVTLQVLALVLLWFHHSGSRPYVGAALLIFLTDRLIYRLYLKTQTIHHASLQILPDNSTVLLQAAIPFPSPKESILPKSLGLSSNLTSPWPPTSHVFLTIPSLSRTHTFQAHPFTIFSNPSSPTQSTLSLLIRAQSGFSRDLLRHAKIHPSTSIRLDGPYGSHSALRMLQDADHTVVVAGGSGVAVAWPLICGVLGDRKQPAEDSDFDIETAISKTALPQCILFVWIVRESEHLSWLGGDRVTELKNRGVDVVIPPPTGEGGRPDVGGLIGEWVDGLGGGKVGVVCSGPEGLNRGVRNGCAGMIGRGWDVDVFVEKFGW